MVVVIESCRICAPIGLLPLPPRLFIAAYLTQGYRRGMVLLATMETAAMNIELLADKLEVLVDETSLERVLDALACMASAKADHIQESYSLHSGRSPLADRWNKAAVACLGASANAAQLGL